MTDTKNEPENADDPTLDEVVATVSKTSKRLAEKLLEDLPGEGSIRASVRAELAEKIARVFLEDEEVASAFVMQGAYDEGREDAALEFAKAGAEPGPRAPDWSDVGGMGEARAIRREEDLCGKCRMSTVCVVPRMAPAEMLLVVRRCALFAG